MKNLFAVILIIFTQAFAGDDLTTALRALDAGDKSRAEAILKKMQQTNPYKPGTLLLDALLNENAEEAKAVYQFIYEEYPNFKYADLCLFRLYSYNYAIGNYITAEKYLAKLKKEYPHSAYVKAEKALPKPPSVKKSKIANSGKTGKFTIQVGAFSNLSNAERLAETFKKKGYSVNVSKKVVGKTIFNVVTVGEYSSRKTANERAKKIANEFGVKTRTIKSVK